MATAVPVVPVLVKTNDADLKAVAEFFANDTDEELGWVNLNHLPYSVVSELRRIGPTILTRKVVCKRPKAMEPRTSLIHVGKYR